MNTELIKYYRLPGGWRVNVFSPDVTAAEGFFQFGPGVVCYGSCETGVTQDVAHTSEAEASNGVKIDGPAIYLPFNFDTVVENLQRERYEERLAPGRERIVNREWVRKVYYFVRKLLPVSVRRHLQRLYFNDWRKRPFPAWPVDLTVDTLHRELLRLTMLATGTSRVPFIWFWPEGATSCLIMTHDVETAAGRDFTPQLMKIDESHGLKSSFQVIPEDRYSVSDEFIREIRDGGFEFNIHDLNHDGKLYRERNEFLRRAAKINEYAHRYGAAGFRAGAMYRNLDWYDSFTFSYDMSVPNVAHLEPKRGGCCTVFPFFIGKILEIPVTMAQDYSLFHILNDYSLDLWKQQLDLVHARNGLMSFITHPDYLIDRKSRREYEYLLDHLRERISRDKLWNALPGEVNDWWRSRSQMELVPTHDGWEIEGPGKDRARIAYAVLEGEDLVYELPNVREDIRIRFS
ncbi:MAG: hypothetical protein ACRD5K_01865 [Candidatus Acidiferrales bacterium]